MEENNVEVMPEVDQLKALLGEQANIMDALVRDNVELIAAVKMFIAFAESTQSGDSDYQVAVNADNAILIGNNLLERIAKDDSHAS